MLYESVAVILEKFNKDEYIGWEYKIVNDVCYLRNNLDGELNTTDKEWNKCESL